MTPAAVAAWMLAHVERDGCVYQDDVVDLLTRHGQDALLRENDDGNVVVAQPVLKAFLQISADTVVRVKPERYWRWRVAEDEPGREQRG